MADERPMPPIRRGAAQVVIGASPRHSRSDPSSRTLRLTERDFAVLDALARFRVVSEPTLAEFVMGAGDGSTAARKRLALLARANLISRALIGWKSPPVYWSTKTGLSLTRWADLAKVPREVSLATLAHRLSVADVAMRWEKRLNSGDSNDGRGWVAIGEDIARSLDIAAGGEQVGQGSGDENRGWSLDPYSGTPVREHQHGVVAEGTAAPWSVPLLGVSARGRRRIPDALLVRDWGGAEDCIAIEVELTVKAGAPGGTDAEYRTIMDGYLNAIGRTGLNQVVWYTDDWNVARRLKVAVGAVSGERHISVLRLPSPVWPRLRTTNERK